MLQNLHADGGEKSHAAAVLQNLHTESGRVSLRTALVARLISTIRCFRTSVTKGNHRTQNSAPFTPTHPPTNIGIFCLFVDSGIFYRIRIHTHLSGIGVTGTVAVVPAVLQNQPCC